MHYPLQVENILKTKKIAMATKVKNTLSSLYETEGSPCGRVSEHPNKSLTEVGC